MCKNSGEDSNLNAVLGIDFIIMDFLTQREQLHLYTSFKISEEVKLKATFLKWQEPL